jgi:phosphoribosyl 1,2-cyclic phosphodiesterase
MGIYSMIAISLQSGSNGNCLYVETKGVKLLFDAGIRCREAQKRLALYGRGISDVNALIISHDHGDHVRHAGVYQRRHGIPLYITPKTLERAEQNHRFGKLKDINYFFSGGTITFGDVTVHTIPSPHDGADGSLFVVTSEGKRLGIFIDLGHVFQELHGPYPDFLKQRIQGSRGHLSNRDAAELLQAGKHLQWACLAHLSKNNNTPQRALRTHRDIVGDCLNLYTASRHEPTGILNV